MSPASLGLPPGKRVIAEDCFRYLGRMPCWWPLAEVCFRYLGGNALLGAVSGRGLSAISCADGHFSGMKLP